MGTRREIGQAFPLEVEVLDAQTRQIETKTRAAIALLVLAASAIALVATGVYAYQTGNPQALSIVWSLVALPLGAVLAYYFGRTKAHEQDDESAT
jgi:membrane protein DedA with SNARE-associated domain